MLQVIIITFVLQRVVTVCVLWLWLICFVGSVYGWGYDNHDVLLGKGGNTPRMIEQLEGHRIIGTSWFRAMSMKGIVGRLIWLTWFSEDGSVYAWGQIWGTTPTLVSSLQHHDVLQMSCDFNGACACILREKKWIYYKCIVFFEILASSLDENIHFKFEKILFIFNLGSL